MIKRSRSAKHLAPPLAVLLVGGFVFFACGGDDGTTGPPCVPRPELAFLGTEDYLDFAGNSFTRYRLTVTNRSAYPAEMFYAAPDLPSCGANVNASRTWVHIYEGQGRHLYGFCGLLRPEDLNSIWFALPRGDPPPTSVYIELEDRLRNLTYRSNTVLIP